nr:vinorine synthase-like [Tanacetum cinerariifolium]
MELPSLFSREKYSTSSILNATEFSKRSMHYNKHESNIKKASLNDVITKRSKHLKESLSHILTQFYPIAGEVKDSLQIECNDKGVYYIESPVNQTLEDFLSYPDDEKVRALNPESPRTVESSIGNFVIGIQVNIFNCGGIGLSTSLSHKIFDGHTYFTFMKAWAAAARGSPEIAKAASNIRPFGPQSPPLFVSSVNLRKRASPPLPNESIGNIVDPAVAICFPESQPDLATLMAQIRESIAKKDSNHIESMKGEKGHEKINEILRELNHLMDVVDERNCIVSSSLLNSGMYEMNFRRGKPIWFYNMNAGLNRLVYLNDTPKGGGVEAMVTLSPEEMEIFERDSELLSYAIVDPSLFNFLTIEFLVMDCN